MPVAELKIDRSFVRDVVAESDAAVLLESTIEMAHRLALSVVAEGAETASEWALLVQLNCDAPFSWQPETVEVLASGTLAISSGPVKDTNGKFR